MERTSRAAAAGTRLLGMADRGAEQSTPALRAAH